jgi:hypothetical protein
MDRLSHALRLLVAAGFAAGFLSFPNPVSALDAGRSSVTLATQTNISINGRLFEINGRLTYPGTTVRGLLLNSRMMNALFDDENPDTIWQWAYPDTHVWDPQRNTDEFVERLPRYAQNGVNMVTVGMQGGNPDPARSTTGSVHTEVVTAFEADGSLKPEWMSRLDEILRAADRVGIVVDVSLFYRWQDEYITTDEGIVNAVNNVTGWLVQGGYTNALLEICNECNVPAFDHDILLRDNVWQLIRQAQERSGGTILVSSAFGGIYQPPSPESVIAQSDFVALHCNNQTPDEMTETIRLVRATAAYKAAPKPIVFNECGTDLTKMDAAINRRASWGYFDQGANNYRDGFQSPAINWRINTDLKRAFFARTKALAGLA